MIQNYGIDGHFYSSHCFAFLIFPLKSNLLALINGLKFTWMITHLQDAFLDLLGLNSGTNHERVNLFTVSPEQEEKEPKKPSLLPHLQQP